MSSTKLDNLFSDLSVDEVLNSLTAELESAQKNEPSTKNWSMDEIDALLGLGNDEEEPKGQEKPQTSAPAKTVAIKEKPVEKKLEASKPVVEKPKVKTQEINMEAEKPYADVPISKPKIEDTVPKAPLFKAESSKAVASSKVSKIKTAEIPVIGAEVKEAKPVDNKTRVFDPSKITTSEEQAKAEKPSQSKSVSVSDKKSPSSIMELASEYAPEEKTVSQKTLTDIRPTYNEDIVHNISRKKIEKPNHGMESDKYRTRFINRPVQHLERTSEYELNHLNDPIPQVERPGFIVKKKNFSNTADLEPIPTIISVDDELNSEKTRVVKESRQNKVEPDSDDEIAGQIKLSGFEEPEVIEKIDEEVAEDSLKKARKEKLKNFKISTNFDDLPLEDIDEQVDVDDENDNSTKEPDSTFSYDYIDEEYTTVKNTSTILAKLSKATKMSFIFASIETIIFIASVVISFLGSSSKGSLEMFNGNVAIYMLVNILLLLCACAFSLRTFAKGLTGILKFKPNFASGPFIMFVLCLIQCFVVIFTMKDTYTGEIIYAPVACFAFALAEFSRFIVLKRALHNFEFCIGGTALYSTQKVEEENDAFEIGRGLLIGEPDIRYSARAKFPEKFVEKSFGYEPVDTLSSKLLFSILIAGLIVSIASGIITKSPYQGFSALVAICSIGIPAFSMFASNLPMLLTNKKLNSRGSAIFGYQSAIECASTNAIVVDSSDLFKKGSCSIDGIKTFNNMRIDEAILDAAAMVIESGGPLVDIFDGVILNRREILPPVESLAYEDRLGLSAWINGHRVLLGSRDLLINHNVLAPEKEVEMKYINRGKKVMYLSVAGKIAAMFVISYFANESIGKTLRNIEKSGVTILVRTCDCNITEDLLCQYFGLPLSAVKIISPISGDIFNKYRKNVLDKSSAGIFHNGTEDTFLNTVVQALRLNKLVSINSIVQIIYSSVAVAIFALLSFLSALGSIGVSQIIAFQLLWMLIACVIPMFKKT